MTQSPNRRVANPYVGPRTFVEAQSHLFFGREREARDLAARIVSERLLLFYAQSGAGKSSLINTRVTPWLRDEEGFRVLPVGRVSGELPPDAAQAANIYIFNLMSSLDQGGTDAGLLAQVTLSDFLARLEGEVVAGPDGRHTLRWVYRPDLPIDRPIAAAEPAAPAGPRFALVIDQFEEIITAHPTRWEEREEFFHQLNQALLDDPTLWVVLTLREDYVAALDPYAPLLFNHLRARFYMERMGVDAALEAIRLPAELGGRPFAPGVAEKLVDDLRQVRLSGHKDTVAGPSVEPVQLQVVCYQLWQNLAKETSGAEKAQITFGDLAAAGDVNQALELFYADTLAAVLAEASTRKAGVTERALRSWFDKDLITETGIRNMVFRNEASGVTGSLPNLAVDQLAKRFVLATELRAGGAWVELAHDRLVAPVRASNALWFEANLSTLQRQAALWEGQKQPDGLLLSGEALAEAENWAAANQAELVPHELAFLAACRKAREESERESRQNRKIRRLAVVATTVAVLALLGIISTGYLFRESRIAWSNEARARQTAEANASLAQMQLDRLEAQRLLANAYDCKKAGDAECAIALLEQLARTPSDLTLDLDAEIADVRRQAATKLVEEGENLAATGDFAAASAKFQQAYGLRPPADAAVYVHVPAGEFTMGSSDADLDALDNEKPQAMVPVGEFWIRRTEVTNAQYLRCYEAGACKAPRNSRFDKLQFANLPVTDVSWNDANDYARWAGGRLPSEAQWEKACRGTDKRLFPWGNEAPSAQLLNYVPGKLATWTAVGSYAAGASPFGVLDMAGNVWEWTSTAHRPYVYQADGRDEPGTEEERVLRGGGYKNDFALVRCGVRFANPPDFHSGDLGFRIVIAPRP